MFLRRILLDPQNGGGGGGSGTPSTTDKSQTGDAGNGNRDVVKAIEGLLSKHGDPNSALRFVLNESNGYRDEVKSLKGKLPPEGSVILNGDDAKHWSAYKALGSPVDVKKSLDAGKDFETKALGYEKADRLRSAAKVAKFDPEALALVAGNLDLDVVDVKGADGKTTQQAIVRGQGDETTPLAEYAEKHWAKVLPSLKGTAEAQAQKTRVLGTPTVNGSRSGVATAISPGGGVTSRPRVNPW